MLDDPPARIVLTDEPYNVPIAGHVTGGPHREFQMASGELTDAEFLVFNVAWIGAIVSYLCKGGVFGTFIDWRHLGAVSAGDHSSRPNAPQPGGVVEDQRRDGQPLSIET
jgi:hypothetical protein